MDITLRRTCESISDTIPGEMARRFHRAPADRIQMIGIRQGILLTPFDPTFQQALALASDATRQDQSALRELTH